MVFGCLEVSLGCSQALQLAVPLEIGSSGPDRSTTYTQYFPDKWASHNGLKLINKQTLMKVTNSGATTKK